MRKLSVFLALIAVIISIGSVIICQNTVSEKNEQLEAAMTELNDTQARAEVYKVYLVDFNGDYVDPFTQPIVRLKPEAKERDGLLHNVLYTAIMWEKTPNSEETIIWRSSRGGNSCSIN